MNTNFFAAARDEAILVAVRLHKVAKRLAFGEALLHGAKSGILCAQANLTHSLLRAAPEMR
jgi:acyl-coenzyme A thioesterase PaaI-like protein